jgi:hypothetical protein
MLVSAAAAVAQNIQTDYDHNFALSNLKTYGFYQQQRGPNDPLAGSPINDRRIHDSLDTQLKANGLASSDHPDFWIGYFVTTSKGLDIQDNRFGLWARRGSINVNPTTEGTIVVIFVDSKTKQEVWRGYASGTINPKNLDKDVTKSVTKLVEKFKKNQAGKN